LEVKLFHRTQRDLATELNRAIDSYWNNNLNEKQLIENVKALYHYNQGKLIKDKEFTTIIQQQCGKRRLEVIREILQMD
jgi:uncharacterized protein (TIGR04540 family)